MSSPSCFFFITPSLSPIARDQAGLLIPGLNRYPFSHRFSSSSHFLTAASLLDDDVIPSEEKCVGDNPVSFDR